MDSFNPEPIVHDNYRYEYIKDIGSGSCGRARLMMDKKKNELVAIKYIPRATIGENEQREIINHRSLRHPNIVRFKEVILTPTHLAIVMEYASGGELLKRVIHAGHLSEDEARFFFQQIISGVSYCHSMGICHRDLKLENTLLDGSQTPQLKICDFGFSKSSLLHSTPVSMVGTFAYIAPEVFKKKEYDGKIADVWSCCVSLFIMLVGAFPFGDPSKVKDSYQKIINAQYSFPDNVHISKECRHLISRIFTADPAQRITMSEIKNHVWFLKNLPNDLMHERGNQFEEPDQPMQSVDEIMGILSDAIIPPPTDVHSPDMMDDDMDDFSTDMDDDMDDDLNTDTNLPESSGEVIYAL